MAKIVLDPEESAIEAFAKLFFSTTRNMGLSDKGVRSIQRVR